MQEIGHVLPKMPSKHVAWESEVTSSTTGEYHERIPGFRELFGRQNCCRCSVSFASTAERQEIVHISPVVAFKRVAWSSGVRYGLVGEPDERVPGFSHHFDGPTWHHSSFSRHLPPRYEESVISYRRCPPNA